MLLLPSLQLMVKKSLGSLPPIVVPTVAELLRLPPPERIDPGSSRNVQQMVLLDYSRRHSTDLTSPKCDGKTTGTAKKLELMKTRPRRQKYAYCGLLGRGDERTGDERAETRTRTMRNDESEDKNWDENWDKRKDWERRELCLKLTECAEARETAKAKLQATGQRIMCNDVQDATWT